ncbi:MAG: thiamine phosphate synthase [Chlorobiales bacterium]|nr:thiamine phosphate synthase [Chlorobiales bacterium]
MLMTSPLFCCITAETSCPVQQAEKALEGGATMIQLRRKLASGSELYTWTEKIQKLCRRHDAVCIVNDRVDIALAAKADGVHLGQEDLPLEAARKLLGNQRIIGVTVSTVTEAKRAERQGCSYAGLGHIFPTVSKKKSSEPVGLKRIREISAFLTVPILAIGGIGTDNVCEVISAGADGIAVISAVSEAADPVKAAAELLKTMQTCSRNP